MRTATIGMIGLLLLGVSCKTKSPSSSTTAPAKPSFAGTWIKDKSHTQNTSNPGDEPNETWTITQDEKKITLIKTINSSTSEPETFGLDGRDATTKESKIKDTNIKTTYTRKSVLSNDGKMFEISVDSTGENEGQTIKMQFKEVWRLSDDGRVLKVLPDSTGSQADTFTRKE